MIRFILCASLILVSTFAYPQCAVLNWQALYGTPWKINKIYLDSLETLDKSHYSCVYIFRPKNEMIVFKSSDLVGKATYSVNEADSTISVIYTDSSNNIVDHFNWKVLGLTQYALVYESTRPSIIKSDDGSPDVPGTSNIQIRFNAIRPKN